MRLMIGFLLTLLLFVTTAYTLLDINETLLLLYLGIFFFTVSAILYGLYAITKEWR